MLGPVGTARCAQVCSKLRSLSNNNQVLWRNFVLQHYQMHDVDVSRTDCDWAELFGYMWRQFRNVGYSHKQRLPARFVFADDGRLSPRFDGPNNAVSSDGRNRPYSTGLGVVSDVDYVVDLSQVCLLTGFAIANHCPNCSGPLKEALLFVSTRPPDLNHARRYDGDEGKKWVNKLEKLVKKPKKGHGWSSAGKNNLAGIVQFTADDASQPVAAFRFPKAPECFNVRLNRHLEKPVVGRYIHFKLLSIYDVFQCGATNNIDVMHLHSFGVALPKHASILRKEALETESTIPDYQRIHEIVLQSG